MIVADASAIVELLVGDARTREAVGAELETRRPVHAPDLMSLEVVSALARHVRSGSLRRADHGIVLRAYAELRIARHPSHPLLPRIADLTARHSAYDAAYVALAELLAAPLITTDRRLARSITSAAVILV
ncbi:type II toxin-antitoxin system VapC family toxin [Gaiella sp.]|uniref:type II toxin-antitoxin system VapC family toxin n=1 Tax=Gaiella sp. TaxID=2663207 RepID=UPI002E34173E|nr:type II toxin-antitoxin system VapC family toxin [Gaiella sp.]HEX5583136.1 type II toxin-antitoxin system VapC family toxin [Gaiella sp.]